MSRFQAKAGIMCTAALLITTAAAAQGIIPDRTTFVTISAPVSVPGAVLPAGEYLFRLADSQASRNVIQIFDKDRSRIFATLITVSAERNEVSGDAVITFRETDAAAPPALRYWYYAGEKGGHEFVYPKDQATLIARASGESVLAVNTSSTDIEEMRKGDISRVDGTAAASAESSEQAASASAAESPAAAQPTAVEQPERAVEQTPAPAAPPVAPEQTAAPAQQPTEPAAPQPAEPATPQAESNRPAATPMTGSSSATPQAAGTSGREMPERSASIPADSSRELPRTASELPVVALAGFLALGAFAGVRAIRRRTLV
jgi:hypothetical protein